MADRWTPVEGPDVGDKYNWRLPVKDEQQAQTVAPGDLLIRPEDMTLVPTQPPKTSGLQHGQQDWTYTNVPDTSWYIWGQIED
jgi:hypothetical protein